MKLLKRIAFVLVLAVVFSSCSKDDDNNSAASLIGTWKLTAEKYNGVPYQLDACELKSTLKFTETKVTNTEYDGTDCSDEYTETYGYTRNGNTININADGETAQIEITKLTSTTLELTQTYVEDSEIYVQTYVKQ